MEQDHLSKLLEAANILQIKGLYESAEVPSDEKNLEESSQIPNSQIPNFQIPNSQIPNLAEPEMKTKIGPKESELTGSQKRKKRKSTSSAESLSNSADNNLSKKVNTYKIICSPDRTPTSNAKFQVLNSDNRIPKTNFRILNSEMF